MSQTKNKIATAAYGFTANRYLTRTVSKGKRDFATATAVTMLGTPDGSPYGWPGFGSSRGLFECYSGSEVPLEDVGRSIWSLPPIAGG